MELETDKVTVEVNAPEAGVIAEIIADEGAEVEVGALLGRIDAAGAAPSEIEIPPQIAHTRVARPRKRSLDAAARIINGTLAQRFRRDNADKVSGRPAARALPRRRFSSRRGWRVVPSIRTRRPE